MPSGLSPRLAIGMYFGPLVFCTGFGRSLVAIRSRSLGLPSQRAISARVTWLASTGSKPWMPVDRSEEHTSELQSLMRISYAVFCLKKKRTFGRPRNSALIIIHDTKVSALQKIQLNLILHMQHMTLPG